MIYSQHDLSQVVQTPDAKRHQNDGRQMWKAVGSRRPARARRTETENMLTAVRRRRRGECKTSYAPSTAPLKLCNGRPPGAGSCTHVSSGARQFVLAFILFFFMPEPAWPVSCSRRCLRVLLPWLPVPFFQSLLVYREPGSPFATAISVPTSVPAISSLTRCRPPPRRRHGRSKSPRTWAPRRHRESTVALAGSTPRVLKSPAPRSILPTSLARSPLPRSGEL